MCDAICMPLIFYRFRVLLCIQSCSCFAYTNTAQSHTYTHVHYGCMQAIAKLDGDGGKTFTALPILFIYLFAISVYTFKHGKEIIEKRYQTHRRLSRRRRRRRRCCRCRFRCRHILEHAYTDNINR